MKLKHLFLLIIVVSTISCKKEINDKEIPTINSFSLNTTTPSVGSQLIINADISDNNLLSSYKITVLDDFGFTADSIEETTRLSHVAVTAIDNNSNHTISNSTIDIPSNTSSGPHVVKLAVLDTKGNENSEEEIYFDVINSIDGPTVSITEPTTSSTYNQGDTIFVAGLIQDNVAIEEIKLETSNLNGTFSTEIFSFDTTIVTSFNIVTDGNVQISIPSLSGDYTLKTSVKDTVGNFNTNYINFIVN